MTHVFEGWLCPRWWSLGACPEPTPEVTPEPKPQPVPPSPYTDGRSDGGSSDPGATRAPVCPNGQTDKLVANLHVVRDGSHATVNFFITQGDSATVYYKEVGESNWTHSVVREDISKVINSDKYVTFTINGLDKNLGYVFGVQQSYGCGGGPIATSVVVDSSASKTFYFSFWQW